jgi:hypothetical protein
LAVNSLQLAKRQKAEAFEGVSAFFIFHSPRFKSWAMEIVVLKWF